MVYSYIGQYPAPLPHRIVLSNGQTRTDNKTFTDQEISDAGYTLVDSPPQYNYPNRVDWVNGNWIVREPNQSEINQQVLHIQAECKRRLYETDYKVIKAVEYGTPVAENIVLYRQQLRDLYNTVNDIDIWNITWPVYEELTV